MKWFNLGLICCLAVCSFSNFCIIEDNKEEVANNKTRIEHAESRLTTRIDVTKDMMDLKVDAIRQADCDHDFRFCVDTFYVAEVCQECGFVRHLTKAEFKEKYSVCK